MVEIKVENLNELVNKIESLANTDNLTGALGKAAAIVEASAKKKAPKGDGTLRNSISSRVEGNDGIVFTTLEYAPYVEYGTGLFAEGGNGRKDVPWHYQDEEGNWHTTSGMKPHPYMRPALEENQTKILKTLMEGLLK